MLAKVPDASGQTADYSYPPSHATAPNAGASGFRQSQTKFKFKRRFPDATMTSKTWAEVTKPSAEHIFHPNAGASFVPSASSHGEVPLIRLPDQTRCSFRRWKWEAGHDEGYEAWLLSRMRNVSEARAAGVAAAAAMRALSPFLSNDQRNALHSCLDGGPRECLRVVVRVAEVLSGWWEGEWDDGQTA